MVSPSRRTLTDTTADVSGRWKGRLVEVLPEDLGWRIRQSSSSSIQRADKGVPHALLASGSLRLGASEKLIAGSGSHDTAGRADDASSPAAPSGIGVCDQRTLTGSGTF